MDIYLQYWEALLDGISNPDVRDKLISEINTRKKGLQNDAKCDMIGAKCNWPYCCKEKRLSGGYCSP
jgi:hypothetical protein